jgi:hypothetical protein
MRYRDGEAAALPQLDCDMEAGDGLLGGKKTAMKAFTIAAVALALLAAPAHAQLNSKRHANDAQKKSDPHPKVDEKAYKAALERIPEPKEKYDPWAVARPGDAGKKSK